MDFSNISSEISFESTLESVNVLNGAALKTKEEPQSDDLIEKIMLLYLKHNLTLVCLEDLMKLFNEIRDECEKLPTGKVQILDMFRKHRDLFDILYFVKCDKCQKHAKVDSENKHNIKCSSCDKPSKTTKTNYFVSMPITKQIKKSVKDNWSSIKKFKTDNDSNSNIYSDAHDGAILRKVLNQYRDSDLNILSLCLNVDGANKFKSNSKSVWPIQLIQNYLPPEIRFLPHNIIVTGLQYVNCDDDDIAQLNFHQFLLPLIDELKELKRNVIEMDIENGYYTFKPVITHCAVDLPAKSKLQETKQFGGYNSCTYCDIPGELVVVENLKKNKRINKGSKNGGKVEPKKPKKFIRYVEGSDSYKLRGEVETLEKMLLASKFNGQSPIDGTKDVSCLVSLEHFHIIWSISTEYMHGCLQGATKRLFNFFFNSKYSGKDYYIPPIKRNALNKKILAIKPISSIVRKDRSTEVLSMLNTH